MENNPEFSEGKARPAPIFAPGFRRVEGRAGSDLVDETFRSFAVGFVGVFFFSQKKKNSL